MTTHQPRWIRRTEVLILAVGIGLRLARYLPRRPLWLDEALLSLNILARPPLNLDPLNDNQVAPLGFLWIEWVVTRLAGTGERALRFLPLVAGIAALIAFARLARRTLESGMVLLATFLAALSPILIYYSAEVKSYGLDWLCAILLMHATLTLIESASRDAWVRWSLAAVFGALMSTAAPFYVAGCALALLVAPAVRGRPRVLLKVIVAGAPAALIFGFHLLTIYDSSPTRSFMQLYWNEAFLEPGVAGLMRAAKGIRELWSVSLFGEAVVASFPPKTMAIIIATSAMGAIAIARRSVPSAVFLLVPAVFAGIASLAKYWPLTPRLVLFLVPTVLLTLPAGLAMVARLAPRIARTPVMALLSVAVIAAAVNGVPASMRWSDAFIDVPLVLQEVEAHAPRHATVYLSADMIAACVYYLAWHPDRPEWAGDNFSQDCNLAGTRTVVGTWPAFVGLAPGAATSAPTIQPEWLEREARGILQLPSPEVWMLLGYSGLQSALSAWFAESGLALSDDRVMGRIRVLKYRQ